MNNEEIDAMMEREIAREKRYLAQMAINNGPPRTWTYTSQAAQTMAAPYGDTYSICEIQVQGGTIPFTVKASPSLMQHAITNMKETGFLYLWNDTESLCIKASEVRALRMTKLTTED